MTSTDVLVCGAGIAGVSVARSLSGRGFSGRITLVDERDPLSLTSARGTEGYRNWWPDPVMVAFMDRSIELLERGAERTGNRFAMNRRGYVFFSSDPEGSDLERSAQRAVEAGAGALRKRDDSAEHRSGPEVAVDGADLVREEETIRDRFPYVTAEARSALHVRRAGWLNAAELGRWLLEEAMSAGVELRRDRVVGVEVRQGRVRGARLSGAGRIDVERLVAAPGPALPEVADMLGVALPLTNELHGKITLRDDRRVVPDDAPLLIWNEPVRIDWPAEMRRRLERDSDRRALLGPLPPAVHCRPRRRGGAPELLGVWTYDVRESRPVEPPRFDPLYGEVVLRGLTEFVPGTETYLDDEPTVDGGYYCRTPENRPLVGPLPVEGAFVIGALSGFGIMGSQAAAELLVSHLLDEAVPSWATELSPARYDDPDYRTRLDGLIARDGQL